MLYNEGTSKFNWLVISILKKKIINLKIALVIDNRLVADEKLENKILNGIQKRLQKIRNNDKIAETIAKIEEYKNTLKQQSTNSP